ncbi:hypothetical protein [Bordetella genomosp. 13]|uniref:Uncharacterized protein n=1 Tax=Bordetella genomosp. 13 TaxID=463040 RepID=A0A1W6ZD81_9BORD|nr:hypothetical protein [Bordetella genomosp. 13]ARP95212.1 hypothetical protein CAL15_12955 [Bordetella genomosp. 13]
MNDLDRALEQYAFGLETLDRLNGFTPFAWNYYKERASRLHQLAVAAGFPPVSYLDVASRAMLMDIHEHPNQAKLQAIIQEGKS